MMRKLSTFVLQNEALNEQIIDYESVQPAEQSKI